MGGQACGSFEGVKAETGEFFRWDIRAEYPGFGSLADEFCHETLKMLLGPDRMSALVEPYSASITVAGLGKEGISLEHSFKLLPGSRGPFPYLDQLLQVGQDLTLMPGHQNSLHIREVFIQGGPTDSGRLGDLRHSHPGHATLADQVGSRVKDCSPDSIPVSFDGLVPELWHP
jgi:hypothetical protein